MMFQCALHVRTHILAKDRYRKLQSRFSLARCCHWAVCQDIAWRQYSRIGVVHCQPVL